VAGVLGVVLVTRPDLVLPRTAGLSTTAGACGIVRNVDGLRIRMTYSLWYRSLLYLGGSRFLCLGGSSLLSGRFGSGFCLGGGLWLCSWLLCCGGLLDSWLLLD
jgi:hypothetical protein